MTLVPFLRPRLVGARFAHRAIPLEILKDLSVLEEFVVAVAKAKFIEENPGRQRTPKGFIEGVELKLTGVEEGSAIPVISLLVAGATLVQPESVRYLEQARDAIIRTVSAAERNEMEGLPIPGKTLAYFDRLGRSLRGEEAIEFDAPGTHIPARLNRETRHRLLEASSLRTLTDEVVVRGGIPEADQDDMTFELQLPDGSKITAPLAPEHREAVLESFGQYRIGGKVALKGVGQFSRGHRLIKIESIEHVTALDPLDVPARLDYLGTLRQGWMNGEGRALNAAGLEWLSGAFTSWFPDELQLPHTFPTVEGGVRFEWASGSRAASLDIDLDSFGGYWHELDTDTDVDLEAEIDMSTEAGWRELEGRVRRMLGGAA